MICWALRMGVAQACAYRRRPSTESALDFSGFGHHFAISKRVPIIIATAMFREGKVGSTIEDALRSPRGSAGRCPWYRVHPSATIGGAVTTPSTFVGVGVGLVGDPGSQDVAHIHLQTGGARCSVCPLPKIEDALRSPRGSAGRCPWYRVHPSATIGGAVTTPSTSLGVGVGLVGDLGSQDVAHIHPPAKGSKPGVRVVVCVPYQRIPVYAPCPGTIYHRGALAGQTAKVGSTGRVVVCVP